MTVPEANSLVSPHKSADGFQVSLHPLVLLSISDYITRHTLRGHPGSVIGILLGQQHGREITLEHTFECKADSQSSADIVLDLAFVAERLQQFKDVYKAPALDLVGWFAVAPRSGPQQAHLPIHRQISSTFNESAVFLAFHPDKDEGTSSGAKLPLSIYESLYEGGMEGPSDTQDGQSTTGIQNLRFRELPYSIETGEAEMISVDFVAKGGASSTRLPRKDNQSNASAASTDNSTLEKGEDDVAAMMVTSEEEECRTQLLNERLESLAANAVILVISTLNARANAIRMLQSRVSLLKKYLGDLPPSYLTNAASTTAASSEVDQPLLRSIQGLVSRLALVIPAEKDEFERESLAERIDVSLVTLLADLTKSVKEVRQLGSKFHMSDVQRLQKGSTQATKREEVPSDLSEGMAWSSESWRT